MRHVVPIIAAALMLGVAHIVEAQVPRARSAIGPPSTSLDSAWARNPPRVLVSAPQPSRIASSDAWLHAGSSASIQLMGHGGLRALGAPRREALVTSAGVTLLTGIGKELYDRRHGGRISRSDLFWDVVGLAAGMGLARLADR